MLHDLVLKIIHFSGPSTTEIICARVGLAFSIVERLLDDLKAEHLLEVTTASRFNELGFRYRLTTRGEQRAADALERSRYASAAPVTLEEYAEVARKQSLRATPMSPGRILEALSDLILSPETVDGLARALYSGRSTLIFGSSGNGKTAILEHYARYSNDTVIIPHALYVHGQLIRIFDAAVHQPVQIEAEPVDDFGLFKPQSRIGRFDQRWLLVRRPVVVVGGELTQESLELSWDPVAKFYQAPPHLKAQDGMFVIDDFGRQRVRPEELLNRWILPMERGFDLLTLHTGESFTVPFEIALMFSTNLRPADLVDEAFLRRIPYKVLIPSPNKPEFREITKRVLASKRLAYSEVQLDHFVDTIFSGAVREPKGVYPRDLVQIIMDSARFDGLEAQLSPEQIHRAMQVYFIE
jgi:predicted ATPase with chaperone activity